MATLFDKFRRGFLGQAHELANRVADTPEAVAQLIRDLETTIAELSTAEAEAQATVNGISRQLDQKHAKQGDLDGNITLLLGDDDPSNDHFALDMQVELTEVEGQIPNLEAELANAQQTHAGLVDAVSNLRGKHREMLRKLSQIRVSAAATTAKSRAADALTSAAEALGEVDSVDNVEDAIRHKADVADQRFKTAVDQVSGGDSARAVALSKAQAALAARRAVITNVAAPVTEPAAS